MRFFINQHDNMVKELFRTDRLVVRCMDTADASFILTLLNTPGWLKYIGDRGVHNLDQARAYILDGPLKSYQVNGFGLYLVELQVNRQPIGICGLLQRSYLADPDIGFAFLPDYIGKGYAFEAVSATLAFHQSNLNLKRVHAITNPENKASIKLLEKLGFVFQKMILPPGEEFELRLYSWTAGYR